MLRLCTISLCLVLFVSCSRETTPTAGPPRRPSTPVRVASATRQEIPVELRAIGNVEAFASVGLKSRVSGMLIKVHLSDGQDVREGDLLFEIDRVPFEEQVRQIEANLARNRAAEKQAVALVVRDQAQARNARSQAERYESLFKQGIASRDQTDQFRTSAEAAEAALAANQAAVESARAAIRADESRLTEARTQLSYCTIKAPISGRAGTVALKQGNLVKDNDSVPLVTIHQIMPVYVAFAVPEQFLPLIRRSRGKLAVEATPDAPGEAPSVGSLAVIDNAVDQTTGTIRLKATFANGGQRLWPGGFVNVVLRLGSERDALVVPTQAVQNNQRGPYVWVIKPDMTAELRQIQVARAYGDTSVIASGLNAGENVVTEGQLRVTNGMKVEVLKAAAGGLR